MLYSKNIQQIVCGTKNLQFTRIRIAVVWNKLSVANYFPPCKVYRCYSENLPQTFDKIPALGSNVLESLTFWSRKLVALL